MTDAPAPTVERPAPARPAFSVTPALIAVVLGGVAGTVTHYSASELLRTVAGILEPLGYLWLSLLRMTVFPLVVSTLLVAVLNSSKHVSAGRVGVAALGTFVAFVCVGGLFSVFIAPPLVELLPEGAGAAMSLAPFNAPVGQPPPEALSLGAWLTALIPTNPFQALAAGELLPVILFTTIFGLALAQVEGPGRERVGEFFEAIYAAMMTLVGWILMAAPPAVFILALSFASNLGLEFAHTLAGYLAIDCGLLLLATLLLYPLTAVLAGVSPARFARGVLPAQMVALGTRSSLASLPALLEGARDRLNLRPQVANLVLPLAVSVFKMDNPVSSMLSLLVLAHLFSIDLTGAQILTFFIATTILSVSSVGIPIGGGAMLSLPAYLAAGIPIEGYLLLKSVESIPDIFKTVINVTGDMSVATILDRYFGQRISHNGEKRA